MKVTLSFGSWKNDGLNDTICVKHFSALGATVVAGPASKQRYSSAVVDASLSTNQVIGMLIVD